MNKKSSVEIQFNWIFVLVAGAIILAFFTTFIIRQRGISESTANKIISNSIDAILSGVEVSSGTVNEVSLEKREIIFDCNSYSIGNIREQLNSLSVFSPREIKTNRFVTWTKDWSLPYRITNLVYLISPEIRYIFVSSDAELDFAKMVFDSFPKEMSKEMVKEIDLSTIKNKGHDKVRFIFFGVDAENKPIPSDFTKAQEGKITALAVNGGNDKGVLEFFSENGDRFQNKKRSYYIGPENLFGAIITDNWQIYDCVMKNSFKKLNIISKVYQKRSNKARAFYLSNGDSCEQFHNDAFINVIIMNSKTFNSADSAIKDVLDDAAKQLISQNRGAQLNSCTLIY